MQSFSDLLKINLNPDVFKDILLCFLTAFAVTLLTIPVIIHFVKKFNLLDKPNDRTMHHTPMPTLGGVAIVLGMFISIISWYPLLENKMMNYFLLSGLLLFIMGVVDDIKNIAARYKFIFELLLAFVIAFAGFRITSFEGLLGIWELPLSIQYAITIILITGITNAFNLIDGIDGLAGSLGFMSLIGLGVFLDSSGDKLMPMITFSFAGGLFAFLYFNINPAKIFMGDTGSLVMGFIIAVASIRLINVNQFGPNPSLTNSPVFSLGLVLIPIFDMVRVFVLRIWNGKSPFTADRNHIHHILLDNGYSHEGATRKLCFVHGLVIFSVYWLKDVKMEIAFIALFAFMLLTVVLFKRMKPRVLKLV